MDWTYVQDNYGVIVLSAAILGIVFGKMIYEKITEGRSKRPVPPAPRPQDPPKAPWSPISIPSSHIYRFQQSEEPMFDAPDENYFGNASKYVLSTLEDQKDQAERWIAYIKQESTKISKEQAGLYEEFKNKQDSLSGKQKALEAKYGYWANQLKMVNTMIENQIQMDIQLKQLKGG